MSRAILVVTGNTKTVSTDTPHSSTQGQAVPTHLWTGTPALTSHAFSCASLLTAASFNRTCPSPIPFKTTQILRHGFFHADPHPGNVAVDPASGRAPVLLFYDFGMMGQIVPDVRERLLDVFYGIYRYACAVCVCAFLGMGLGMCLCVCVWGGGYEREAGGKNRRGRDGKEHTGAGR